MNMKKWFKRKNENKNPTKNESSIYKFLDKEGFYMVLFLCVCIVAVTAVWVTKTNIDRLATDDIIQPPKMDTELAEVKDLDEDIFPEKEEIEEIENEDKIEEPQTIVIEDINEEDESIPTVASQKETTEESNAQSAPPKLVDSNENVQPQEEEASTTTMAMTTPMKGELGMEYAVDSLTYSKTLEQYTTHNGIDIKAPLDSPVMAVEAGEVIEVVVDSKLGKTIAIAHANNIITRYANLSTLEMVSVGDKVEKGKVISGVGETALFEISEGPHLHFEVLVEGEYVDPKLYLPMK